MRPHPFLTAVPCVYILLSIFNSDSDSLDSQMCVSLIWREAGQWISKTSSRRYLDSQGPQDFQRKMSIGYLSISFPWLQATSKQGESCLHSMEEKKTIFYEICVYRYICIYALHMNIYYLCVYSYVCVLYAYIYISFLVTYATVTISDAPLWAFSGGQELQFLSFF